MKILYISFHVGMSLGVSKKIIQFCKSMYDICNESDIRFKGVHLNLGRMENKTAENRKTDYFEQVNVRTAFPELISQPGIIVPFFRIRPVFKAAYREINIFKPDVIIFRYNMLEIPFPFNPKKVSPNIFFISEHNTKETDELIANKSGLSRIRTLIESIKANIFFKNIDAIIGVTSEIAEYEIVRAQKKIPSFILTNGVNVDTLPIKSFAAQKTDKLKIIFVSSFFPLWQGADRLLSGIKAYNGNVKIELNIVGTVNQGIIDLVKAINKKHKIILHGLKFGYDLDKLFDKMDIAIGTLGIHRKKLNSASTLKVREYMSRGIPFVISHFDEDIKNGFPLCLRLPPDDNPVDMDLLIKFKNDIYNKYGKRTPEIMRKYALQKMDYKVKVKKLLNFILQNI